MPETIIKIQGDAVVSPDGRITDESGKSKRTRKTRRMSKAKRNAKRHPQSGVKTINVTAPNTNAGSFP